MHKEPCSRTQLVLPVGLEPYYVGFRRCNNVSTYYFAFKSRPITFWHHVISTFHIVPSICDLVITTSHRVISTCYAVYVRDVFSLIRLVVRDNPRALASRLSNVQACSQGKGTKSTSFLTHCVRKEVYLVPLTCEVDKHDRTILYHSHHVPQRIQCTKTLHITCQIFRA